MRSGWGRRVHFALFIAKRLDREEGDNKPESAQALKVVGAFAGRIVIEGRSGFGQVNGNGRVRIAPISFDALGFKK